MKTKQLLLSCAIVLLCTIVSVAQNPVATLEHAGATQVFSGQNSFVEAYNASANGDQIYLSTGFFTPPPAIEKGIKIIGAGHFPDSLSVAKRTFVMGGLTINKGADSLRLEGMYINGDIRYQGDASINYVKIIRCRLVNANFNSNSTNASKNHCSFEECFIEGQIDFSNYGESLNIYHSVISSRLNNISGSALIEGNLFMFYEYLLININGSLIKNNIILSHLFHPNYSSTSNTITNNLFVLSSIDFGTNSSSNNYLGVPQADIFINQTGNAIDYTHDYHLKNPEKYIGTDGTQVGLYGGTTPFKEKGLPSNPQVIKKNIADQTDANGNLPIKFIQR